MLLLLDIFMLIVAIFFSIGYVRVLAKVLKMNEECTKLSYIASLTVLVMVMWLI